MNRTKIGWTDYTWNPVTGCKHGCSYCYARRLAEGRLRHRYSRGFVPTYWGDRLTQPQSVKKPSRIFVSSMGDLFGEWLDRMYVEHVLAAARSAPWHTYQLLTKNPARLAEFDLRGFWAGTSVSNRRTAHRRMAELCECNADVRFVSFEPLFQPVALGRWYPDWIIIGAMTGPGATPPPLGAIAYLTDQARERGIPVFHKRSCGSKFQSREFPEVK